MANGGAEMAVREVKIQCKTSRVSAEQNTSVHIADGSPSLSWLPFCGTRHEQNETWSRWKNERTESNWTKMEKANGATCRERLVP